MSISVSTVVWKRSKQKGNALLVLLALADYANDKKQELAWPSVSTLASKVRLSERQVQRILPALAESGELAIQKGQGPHGTNLYRVTIDARRGDIHCKKGVTRMSPNPSSERTIKRSEKVASFLKGSRMDYRLRSGRTECTPIDEVLASIMKRLR